MKNAMDEAKGIARTIHKHMPSDKDQIKPEIKVKTDKNIPKSINR